MALSAAIRQRLKTVLPAAVRTRLVFANQYVRSWLCPHHFECYVLVKEDAPEPQLGDIRIDLVESKQALTAEQHAFLDNSDLGPLAVWTLLRQLRAGPGFLFLARAPDGCYCTYCWIVPSRYNRRRYPVMVGDRSLFLGPVYTDPRYRGRNIMAPVMQYAIHYVTTHGYSPIWGLVAPTNTASIRGCDKAGWVRAALWRGTSLFRDRLVWSREVAQPPAERVP